jgi:hypothetical protein
MNPQQPAPKIHLTSTEEYRENYANSVQVRVSLWDFFLSFGTINQTQANARHITGLRQSSFVDSPRFSPSFTRRF